MAPDVIVPSVNSHYLHEVLTRLVQTPSVNPWFDATSRGEGAIADVVATECGRLGLETTVTEAEPGRASVIARLRGSGGGRSLLLYAHHDTVGITGMAEPFSAHVRDGRMYGRGSYDMKCGLAACLAALRGLGDAGITLKGEVILVSVADEEVASIGISDVLRSVRADAAIVTEPTELRLCLAHKGFTWLEVETWGLAAHGSQYDVGIDANMRMGRFLARLDILEQALRRSPPHPLLGPPTLHAAVLAGGTGPSTYAASCQLDIERRSLPDESEAIVVAQIQEIIDVLHAEDASFNATVRATLTRPSFAVAETEPIVAAVRRAASVVLGAEPESIGVPYWMDASLIAAAGIPTVVFGPVGDGAHADVEWVDLKSVEQVADVLARTAVAFCGAVTQR